MSKFKKFTSVLVAFLFLFALTSCSYSFYDDWKKAGAGIENADNFNVLTVDQAADMINSTDDSVNSFVLVVASSNTCAGDGTGEAYLITVLNNYAEYFQTDKKINFVSSNEALDNATSFEARNDFQTKLKLHDYTSAEDGAYNGLYFVVIAYKKGKVLFDTSNSKYFNNPSTLNRFYLDDTSKSIDYGMLCNYIFFDFDNLDN